MISTTPDSNLELIGTDLEIYAKIKVKVEVLRQGSFCIHARNFSEILREMPSNIQMDMEISEENNMLNNIIFKTDDYPSLKFVKARNLIKPTHH
jgi:DNA polymerase III sliding clamp (beta) subunit (PCNA family)